MAHDGINGEGDPLDDDLGLIPQPAAPVVDPVCGMAVEPGLARGAAEFGEKRFFFCSEACQRRFDTSPEEYAESREPIRIPTH
jgi:YHS domain-containing protein